MMKKRLFAALTALFCTASMAAMPVSAMYTDYSVTKRDFSEYDERGTIHVTDYGTFNGIVVETDGTVLTEEMVHNLEGYVKLKPWEEVYLPQGACNWVEYSAIPGESAYMIGIDPESDAQREILGRQIMLEHDFVKAVHIVDYVSKTYAHWPNAHLSVQVKEGVVLERDTIPELAEFDNFRHAYENVYSYSIQDIEASAFNANLTGKTEYEQLQFGLQFTKELEEKYSDILLSVSPAVITPASSTPSELSAASIWDTAGDLDANGEIDASDAAELLVLSAMKGATVNGGADPFTAEQKSAADLNGDTFCDANDAAYILQFAAEAGAGSELSIGEFMTR